MTFLENEFIRVAISSRGAELTSVYHKQFNLEYLWQADPLIWGKHSPILFPIVGTLKKNQYYYQGNPYSLTRHGFARDMDFDKTSSSINEVNFQLASVLLNNYPFDFELNIRYTLVGASLSVEYKVNSTGESPLYFSIGAHPAFNVPLSAELKYDDYFLEFSDQETEPRWPITNEGLIASTPVPFFQYQTQLKLTHELFAKDALVFKGLNSHTISLKSNKDPHGLNFNYTNFPFMGLWAAPNADFVCIEPWCGIADSENSNQQIEEKEGIIRLEPAGEFVRSWAIEVF